MNRYKRRSVDLTEHLTVESAWFDLQPATIDRSAVDPADQQGFDVIGDGTLAQLCGAPAGATVTMRLDGQALSFDVAVPTSRSACIVISTGIPISI
ncbi:hypothetical protein WJ74_22580 [Burkholderia ubonensis]|nr:hypothetical protein WJ74_22580 [Burkholderia ubonensis]